MVISNWKLAFFQPNYFNWYCHFLRIELIGNWIFLNSNYSSLTPNKSYKELTCSRNQNHKHIERPIAWAYNTENNFPDHAITKLADFGQRAVATPVHRELAQPPGPKKLTLQEAFEMNRYCSVATSYLVISKCCFEKTSRFLSIL